jgi:hypothetical protein
VDHCSKIDILSILLWLKKLQFHSAIPAQKIIAFNQAVILIKIILLEFYLNFIWYLIFFDQCSFRIICCLQSFFIMEWTMRIFLVFGIVFSVIFGACADPEDLGVSEHQLTAARTRVIQECSQAMSGSWWTYNETNWPAGTTYATYAYTSADIGAWNLLLANYGGYASNGTYYPGFYVSCMRYRSEGYLPSPYSICHLSLTTGYGSYEMPNYTCQGNCSTSHKRGGQCKAFMNLVAYRSGQYQLPGYGWKNFPSDSTIVNWSTAVDQMPYATYSNIEPGDFLRRPYGHALIVVRKISSAQVIVLDSNWTDGDGYEKVTSHEMAFTGTGKSSDLGTYRVLKCAYTGGC